MPLYNNIVYGLFTLGNKIQKLPTNVLDIPINYVHLPSKLGDDVFISNDIKEIEQKCPKAFDSGLPIDKASFFILILCNNVTVTLIM